jgi:hypothetical protein
LIESEKIAKVSMKCPCCHRRAFDVSATPSILKSRIKIEMKCPQYRKIVAVNFAEKLEFK